MDDKSNLNISDNIELIINAQKGDKNSISSLLTIYSPLVRKIALKFNSQQFDTDDLAQEGMLGLLNAIMHFDVSSDVLFKTYAYTCIINKIRNSLNVKNKNIILNTVDTPLDDVKITVYDTPELQFIEREQYELLLQNVYSVLSDNEKSVLHLYLAGNSYSEIAEALNKNEKSVDNALQRIRSKLSKGH